MLIARRDGRCGTPSTKGSNWVTSWRLAPVTQAAGLRVASAFRAFIVTLPRTAVVSTMGTLREPDWRQVVTRVKLAMELT